jgi:hypothetical protein
MGLQQVIPRNTPTSTETGALSNLSWIENRTATIIASSEAKATRRNRDYLQPRFAAFAALHHLPLSSRTAILFCTASAHKAASKLIYLSGLMARLEPATQLELYRRGLRRIAATEPLTQAQPLSLQRLQMMLQKYPHISNQLLMAWKSASRIDELRSLRTTQIVQATDGPTGSIVIDWGARTKTSAMAPHQAHLLIEIRPPTTGGPPISELVQYLKHKMGTNQPVFTENQIQQLVNALQAEGMTGHSVKAGAITALAQAAAQGLIPVQLLPLIAKHSQQVPPLPQSTVRYIRDRATLAKALGTGAATSVI